MFSDKDIALRPDFIWEKDSPVIVSAGHEAVCCYNDLEWNGLAGVSSVQTSL
jgi:hypothetical protein